MSNINLSIQIERTKNGKYDIKIGDAANGDAYRKTVDSLDNVSEKLQEYIDDYIGKQKTEENTHKYCVTVVRTGCIFVKAETKEEALIIANSQTTGAVNWSDDWEATDAEEDDTILDGGCVTEKAY